MNEVKIIYFFHRRSKAPCLEKAAVVNETPKGYRINIGHGQTTMITEFNYMIFTSFEDARSAVLDRLAIEWKVAKDRVALMQKRTREVEALREEKFLFTWAEKELNG